jgi:transaldolase/glucose-6-phosphate isomerase
MSTGWLLWTSLAASGAHPQRLLWASTSSKDPRFRDVMYVESLIGPDTVDTIPPATLDAFRDHGKAENQLEQHIDDARQVLATLSSAGISIDDLTARLLDDGVKGFSAAFDALLGSIEKKRAAVLSKTIERALPTKES